MYISNRKETEEELKKLQQELFNFNSDSFKQQLFFKLCETAHSIFPSERCKTKKCVLGFSCGNLDSKIIFVAEAPGRSGAQRTGIPIYGDPSGDNFEKILNIATTGKLTRKDLFITNTFLWNPTNELGNNDKPTEEEIYNTLPLLEAQINIVEPELIIALGNTAYNTLGKISALPVTGCSLREMTGKVFKWDNDILLGVMYHPSPRVVQSHRTIEEMAEDLKSILKSYFKLRIS